MPRSRPVPIIGVCAQHRPGQDAVQVCRGTLRDDLPDPRFRFNVVFVRHEDGFPLHRHQYTELVLVLGGQATHVGDHGTHPIRRGDVLVITPGQSHGFVDAERLDLCNVQFDAAHLIDDDLDLQAMPGFHALMDLDARHPGATRAPQRLHLDSKALARCVVLCHHLEDELHGGEPGRKTVIRGMFQVLVTLLSRHYDRQQATSSAPAARLARVVAYMRAHLRAEVEMPDLATLAGLSSSQFQRTFRRIYGMTPVGYLTHLRIAEGRRLLADRGLSIAAIAAACGFASQAFFAARFRDHTGLSPSAYRKALSPPAACGALVKEA